MQNGIHLEEKADNPVLLLPYMTEIYMTSGSNFLVYRKLLILQGTSALSRHCIR